MTNKSDCMRKILAFVDILPKLVPFFVFLSILPKVTKVVEVIREYNTEIPIRVWYNEKLCYRHELPISSVSSDGECKKTEIRKDKELTMEDIFELARRVERFEEIFGGETKILLEQDEKLTIEEIFKLASKRIEKHEDIIIQSCKAHDVDENLMKGLITQESRGDSAAVSRKNAKGYTQLMDPTSKELAVKNPFDPKENIDGGTRYLREQLDEFGGNVKLALAAYNAGSKAVRKYNGIPPYKETQNYVKFVLIFKKMYEQQGTILASRI